MKAIMMSIRPEWVAKILNGEKTIEIRKTLPKCDLPIDVYIYCTKDKKYANLINRGGFLTGMVVAKFTLNKVEEIIIEPFGEEYKQYELEWCNKSCLSFSELNKYLKGKIGYAWHIDNLKIFDKPKPLSQFLIPSHKVQGIDKDGSEKTFTILKPLDRAPQSWCYIEI